ncbi:DNA helicase [Glycomyces fuscus]|nr:DNA helicase [Glycomyces fuscus]
MTIEPTEEQQAARDTFAEGRELALIAGAGTGKTSTLALMAEAAPHRRGLYIAFNRGIANSAAALFDGRVQCRTVHQLAFHAVGKKYGQRLNASRIPAQETARTLGIDRDLDVDGKSIDLFHQVRLVRGMVRRFCYSADPHLMAHHMEHINGLDDTSNDDVAVALLPFAQRAWEDLQLPEGRLRFEHDHYLKMWALTEPDLKADFVLLDEAQDTNSVFEKVFLAQDSQRVCVGDPAQQIYAWRGARDIMSGFQAEHLHLTRSFRFGQPIADVANRWLEYAESPMRLTGHGPAPTRVSPLAEPDAVLCRGNADALKEVVDYLERGVPVALAGGGHALESIAEAADRLRAGQRTYHPELFLFSTWPEVQDFVESDPDGQQLRPLVKAVDTFGTEVIRSAVKQLSDEQNAQVTVSTAHKAKGRQWDSVRIGEGFARPPKDEDGVQLPMLAAEARLVYVAVTRARHGLDIGALDWLDAYEAAISGPDQHGHLNGRPMIDLPLTTQLRFSASPVSEFLEQHLPHHSNIIREYQKYVDTLPHPAQPMNVRRPNWANLGRAIDYRLRLSFGGDLGGAVTLGIDALGSPTDLPGAPGAESCKALYTAGLRLLEIIGDHRIGVVHLDDAELTRLCYVAGFFEDIMRNGVVSRQSMLASASPGTVLADLVDSVPSYVVEDIADQLRLSQGPLSSFQGSARYNARGPVNVCGPVFTGSSDIGGADADFILDGLLLDCKATTRPRHVGREEVYQLAGYLLLDYDDAYRIDRVGLYLSRQGGLITWDVNEFLRRLGAPAPLPRLRTEFRSHLQHRRRTPTG